MMAPLLGNCWFLTFKSVYTYNQQRFECCLPLFEKLKVSVLFSCLGFSFLCAEAESLPLASISSWNLRTFSQVWWCNKSCCPYLLGKGHSPCHVPGESNTRMCCQEVCFSASHFCWRASLSRYELFILDVWKWMTYLLLPCKISDAIAPIVFICFSCSGAWIWLEIVCVPVA